MSMVREVGVASAVVLAPVAGGVAAGEAAQRWVSFGENQFLAGGILGAGVMGMLVSLPLAQAASRRGAAAAQSALKARPIPDFGAVDPNAGLREIVKRADQLVPVSGSAFSSAFVGRARELQREVAFGKPRNLLGIPMAPRRVSDTALVDAMHDTFVAHPVAKVDLRGAHGAQKDVPVSAVNHWDLHYDGVGYRDQVRWKDLTQTFASARSARTAGASFPELAKGSTSGLMFSTESRTPSVAVLEAAKGVHVLGFTATKDYARLPSTGGRFDSFAPVHIPAGPRMNPTDWYQGMSLLFDPEMSRAGAEVAAITRVDPALKAVVGHVGGGNTEAADLVRKPTVSRSGRWS